MVVSFRPRSHYTEEYWKHKNNQRQKRSKVRATLFPGALFLPRPLAPGGEKKRDPGNEVSVRVDHTITVTSSLSLSSVHTQTQIRRFQIAPGWGAFQKTSFSMEHSCVFTFLRGRVNGVLDVVCLDSFCLSLSFKSRSLFQGSQITENC